MKLSKVISMSVIALSLAVPLVLMARQDGPDPGAIQTKAPEVDQSTASKLVFGLLSDSRYAYRPRPMDAKLSQDIFKHYFEALDNSKMFFTAEDIAEYDKYKKTYAQSVKDGDLESGFEVFKRYKQRAVERYQYARALLKQDIFDFSGDDRWHYDREDAPWATKQQLDDIWKKSVKNDWLRLKLANKQPDEIRKTLDKRYNNMETLIKQMNEQDAFRTFLNAYTSSVDPHTDYMDPRTAALFTQSMSLSLEGIGAQLQKQDEVVVIREIIAGGPVALSNKFKPGDKIIAVGQGTSGPMEDVIGWRIDDVVQKIKGKKGTQVRLDVIPADRDLDSKPVRIVLTRAKIRLEEQAAKSEIMEFPATDKVPARRVGVIKLPAFYEDFEGRRRNSPDYTSATRDVKLLLEKFRSQKLDGVVIDLRNNGGGSLTEAVELTGLFIDTGPVVQVRESGGRVSVSGDEAPGVSWEGPLAVLVNRASASASEIFAGAIQDYGRGLVIGETTYGKGTVQNVIDLDRWPGKTSKQFGQLKLTIAQFFLPGGSSTQNKGVVPDIKFPVMVDAEEFGESTHDNALPWSRIAGVEHKQYGNFSSLIPQLSVMHEKRVLTDKEFQWFEQDVEEYRAEKAKKYISLNEAERRADRDRQEKKRKDRQEERKKLGLALDPLAEDSLDDGLDGSERNVVKDTAREKAAEDAPDPLLRESAAILNDAIFLLKDDKNLSATVLPLSRTQGSWAD